MHHARNAGRNVGTERASLIAHRFVRMSGRNAAALRRTGDSRAFDAVTGRKLWQFHTVPQPGEPGHETWLNDGWKGRSGTNVWVWYMTVDQKTDTLYMPVGGPSPNYDGTTRPGANLFGNSLVALMIVPPVPVNVKHAPVISTSGRKRRISRTNRLRNAIVGSSIPSGSRR